MWCKTETQFWNTQFFFFLSLDRRPLQALFPHLLQRKDITQVSRVRALMAQMKGAFLPAAYNTSQTSLVVSGKSITPWQITTSLSSCMVKLVLLTTKADFHFCSTDNILLLYCVGPPFPSEELSRKLMDTVRDESCHELSLHCVRL